jgi:hypothetical protein
MVSAEGGVDIEEVAATNPDAIRKLAVDPRYGLLPHQAYWLATALYDDPSSSAPPRRSSSSSTTRSSSPAPRWPRSTR